MVYDYSKKAKNTTDTLRRFLLNVELEKTYAEQKVKHLKSIIRFYEGATKPEEKQKYIAAKIQLMRYQEYLNAETQIYNETWEGILRTTDFYIGRYKKVFIYRFICGWGYQEIADKTGYSVDSMSKIIPKIKKDLIDYNITLSDSKEEEE